MTYFDYTKPKMLIADRGKLIRDVNDVPRDETDENGNVTHFEPYYTDVIFVADGMTFEELQQLYVEEDETNINQAQ